MSQQGRRAPTPRAKRAVRFTTVAALRAAVVALARAELKARGVNVDAFIAHEHPPATFTMTLDGTARDEGDPEEARVRAALAAVERARAALADVSTTKGRGRFATWARVNAAAVVRALDALALPASAGLGFDLDGETRLASLVRRADAGEDVLGLVSRLAADERAPCLTDRELACAALVTGYYPRMTKAVSDTTAAEVIDAARKAVKAVRATGR